MPRSPTGLCFISPLAQELLHEVGVAKKPKETKKNTERGAGSREVIRSSMLDPEESETPWLERSHPQGAPFCRELMGTVRTGDGNLEMNRM